MWETVFLQILNMSYTASYVILFLLWTRILPEKVPKIFSYALWSVALFRLVCPVSFESSFSWFSLMGTTPQQMRPFPETFTTLSDVLPSQGSGNAMQAAQPAVEAADPLFSGIFTLIWLVGIAALLIYSVVSLLKLRRRLKDAMQESGNIYSSAS
ncbi:MAG: M56 family metallopeptidase, partial [Oscillospiraceae bacterium]